MTINYYGQLRDARQNTRVAEIGFDEANERDKIAADRLIDLMEKTTAWRCCGGFDDCYLVSVDDRADFDDFKDWYKGAKKSVALWMKFEF